MPSEYDIDAWIYIYTGGLFNWFVESNRFHCIVNRVFFLHSYAPNKVISCNWRAGVYGMSDFHDNNYWACTLHIICFSHNFSDDI